jgi:DNA-binding NtrC family response regulator
MATNPPPQLCVIEDDAIMGESLHDRFLLEGFGLVWHKSAASALAAIATQDYAVVISDIRLPDLSGEALYERLRKERTRLPPFIFITGYGSIDRAVHLLKLGAADYITKPFDLDRLVEKVRALCESHRPLRAADSAQPTLGLSPAMRQIEDMLPRLAKHAGSVLITGESGVGKESVALALHQHAFKGEQRPFVAINCGALAESLLEAELFGYEKGAFTGALRTKKGVFEQADGGTLFLDEIGDMPLAMQVKFLRAIQERRITRVGGEMPIPVDLRLTCATHHDLKRLVEQGLFREDLFYRINVIHLRIPPLRERREDILWFAERFLQEFAAHHRDEQRTLTRAAEVALLQYPWPGNIRELRHAIERACILSGEAALEPAAFFDEQIVQAAPDDGSAARLSDYLQDCERRYIVRMLDSRHWRIAEAAAALGISRKNLWEKMRKLGISEQTEKPTNSL